MYFLTSASININDDNTITSPTVFIPLHTVFLPQDAQ